MPRKKLIKLSVQKQPDANTVEVERALRRRMDSLARAMPESIQLGMAESQAEYVEGALSGVTTPALHEGRALPAAHQRALPGKITYGREVHGFAQFTNVTVT